MAKLQELKMTVLLNEFEIRELYRQAPSTKANGGFQGLLVGLQQKIDRRSGRLTLDMKDLERIEVCVQIPEWRMAGPFDADFRTEPWPEPR
jgi:hypothetical protein